MWSPLKALVALCCFSPALVASDYYNKYYADYECNTPLLDRAILKATSSMQDRGPNNTRLDGGNAWTAQENDFDQQLIINLGSVMNITRIATQGRPHSAEFVTEFGVSYGYNGLDYADYKEPGGDSKMFKGNIDGNNIKRNEFEVPIIAQWLRINPTRWRDRISLRLEVYGCDYDADTLYMNGSSLVKWDLTREPISASRESLRLRFKTSMASGVLLYSRGSQGDFIALQLKDNRLLLNMDLGSGLMTPMSVGSLLDDNIWHDVLISRNRRDVVFSVDRVITRSRLKGEFSRLNLNRALYIGGVSNKQEGIVVTQNFTGCIENLYLNTTNMIRDIKEAYENNEALRYEKVNTLYTCPEPPIVPVTFLTEGSFARLRGYEGSSTLNVSLSFRSYEPKGILIQHNFTSQGYLKVFMEDGKVKVELVSENNPPILLDNYDEVFNDGRWHSLVLSASTNSLVLSIDQRPMRTTRLLKISTGSIYYIAGTGNVRGFVGCMRLISIDGNYKLPSDWRAEEYEGPVVFDSCRMTDRCNPNPCKHDGVCQQNSREFFCDCSNTGYAGAVCHTPIHPLSCQAYKNVMQSDQRAEIQIDVDGSGPLDPFQVTCEFFADGRVLTVVSHSNEMTTNVDGFQEAGAFRQDITYTASAPQLEALLNRSHTCRQRLSYSCHASRLLNSPSDEINFRPFAWWMSRHNQRMDYWAGALPGSRKCECGVLGTCIDPSKWCNCDSGQIGWQEDGGDLTEKEHLPVKQLRFGDTGTPLDEKEGRYTLGPLICEGDDLFNNMVTFRVTDATINLPTFDMGHSGDIYFEFKTTIENAVLFHSKGPQDYIKLSIIGGNQIQFQYQAGSGPLGISSQTSKRLADDEWHSVSVERNRKEARIVVDGSDKSEVREPPGPVRALQLNSPFVLGASVDYRDGFVGCIRALLLNGRPQDLRGYAERGIYGVGPGCAGRCHSNPCLNNGTCHEGYDSYTCDCRWTAFKGPICADEIGVNMKPNSMVKYDFMGSWRSTIAEKIRVGFTTTNPKGFLLGLFSNISAEYLTIMVSNSGYLRVVFDFGFERQEIIFPNKHFGLGQYHDVRLTRKNGGSTLVLQVDNYEAHEYNFDIKESADAQFNNIQYMYIGRNESMAEGFAGCVSRVEFDDIYPLKLLFQEAGPLSVKSYPGPLTEDFCGVEPVTHPPLILETRPPPLLDEDQLAKDYHRTDEAILGGVLAVIFIALVIVAAIVVRMVARHRGEYLTQEEAGAAGAPDSDEAALRAHTGPRVLKRQEFFI
ncbi:neurexin-4 isoform X2 [Arctopsyche grandis]|uniref:neurexin-4 isoform X2 n=1 Tax=Arctopsyche grandis TaxID=121162 RepID=UPI00406D8C74